MGTLAAMSESRDLLFPHDPVDCKAPLMEDQPQVSPSSQPVYPSQAGPSTFDSLVSRAEAE
jgi:hypothetical protein